VSTECPPAHQDALQRTKMGGKDVECPPAHKDALQRTKMGGLDVLLFFKDEEPLLIIAYESCKIVGTINIKESPLLVGPPKDQVTNYGKSVS
jgi:hypothetical protein